MDAISHYRLLEKLGAGGMGVVYKARDVRLDRLVALKVLPPQTVGDAAGHRRLAAEARAASALNHPNIVTIYDVGIEPDAAFIAMEYLPGTTLAELLARRALPLDVALGYAIQVAEALATAHAAGIVHRDLKPGNIMVTEGGTVKLLDFGLAKLLIGRGSLGGDLETSSVVGPELAITESGVILGTAAYMSPEQASGKEVDHRSDIFSFGIVLYELLTGGRPFRGGTPMETVAALLREQPPPPSAVTPGLPVALDRTVAHCLEKDPARRFQSAADVARLLEDAREDLRSGATGRADDAPFRSRRWLPAAGAALLGLTIAAIALWRAPQTERAEPEGVFTRLTFDSGLTTDPAVSPDGKLLAYASDRGGGNLDIWLRQLAGGESIRVTSDPADEREPHFSPDGTRIVFRSDREGGGLYVTSTLGGSEPQFLVPQGRAPRFSPDGGSIAYQVGEANWSGGRPMRSKVFVVAADGGQPREITAELPSASRPIWSPDGRYILVSGSVIADVSVPADWYIVPAAGGPAVRVEGMNAMRATLADIVPYAWTESNDVVFSAARGDSTNLWRVPLQEAHWRVTPPAARLTSGAGTASNASLASAAGTAHLVFSVLESSTDLWSLSVTPAGLPAGAPEPLTDDAAIDGTPMVDAAGKLLVFNSNRSGVHGIWAKDLETGKEMPLTTGPSATTQPVVSPGGGELAYYEGTGEDQGIFYAPLRPAAGKPRVRRRVTDVSGWPYDWSRDGEWLLHAVRNADTERWEVAALHVQSARTFVLAQHPARDMTFPQLSPDGNWVVAAVHSEGRMWLMAAPYRAGVAIRPDEWFTVSGDAGWEDKPRWSADGERIYHISDGDGFRCLWAQTVEAAGKRPAGPPFPVFHSHTARTSLRNVDAGFFKIAVAPGRLVFPLPDLRGNIWMRTSPGSP